MPHTVAGTAPLRLQPHITSRRHRLPLSATYSSNTASAAATSTTDMPPGNFLLRLATPCLYSCLPDMLTLPASRTASATHKYTASVCLAQRATRRLRQCPPTSTVLSTHAKRSVHDTTQAPHTCGCASTPPLPPPSATWWSARCAGVRGRPHPAAGTAPRPAAPRAHSLNGPGPLLQLRGPRTASAGIKAWQSPPVKVSRNACP